MKTDYSDRLAARSKKTANKTPLIIGAAIVAGAIAVGAWFYLGGEDKKPEPIVIRELPEPVPAPLIEDEIIRQAPDIPQQTLTVEDDGDDTLETPAPELPDLADSDAFTRDLIQPLSDSSDISQWLSTDSLLQKAVAVVDGLARGVVLKKVIPGLPEGNFTVIKEQDIIWLDEANYARYDNYTNTITSIPPQSLANSFHRLRPLLEKAYGELGGQPEAIDNRIIAAIDRMLATPDHNGPFALKRESVHYQFADPTLEALPGVQKQLLRIGPKNRTKLLNYLRELRVALLAENSARVD